MKTFTVRLYSDFLQFFYSAVA